jgi:hypothetical protein
VASRVQRVSVAGSWWRQTPYGSDPLWLASPPSSGRWQHGNKLAAIYLADEEPTAWAEWYRGIAELGLPPTRVMPRDLDAHLTSLQHQLRNERPRSSRALRSTAIAVGPMPCNFFRLDSETCVS